MTLRRFRDRALAFAIPLALIAAAASSAFAQQRPLDHEDVLHWNRIASPSLSPDGAWLAYVLTAMEGDPVLRFEYVARQPREAGPWHAVRGARPVFTSDSRFVVYEIPPVEAAVDSLKREGKKLDELPPDSLGFAEMEAVFAEGPPPRTVAAVENFKVASEGSWVAYVPVEEEEEEEAEGAAVEAAVEPAAEPEPEPEPEPAPEPGEEGHEEEEEKKKDEGSPLVLLNLETGEEVRYEKVAAYHFAAEAAVLTIATSAEDGEGDGVFVVTLDDMARHAVMEGAGNYEQLAIAEDGTQVAFVSDRDDYEAEQAEFTLYHGSSPAWESAAVASSQTEGVPAGWWVSGDGSVDFSDGGGRIRFGTAPRPEPEDDDDEISAEDKVTLDIWNWKDPYLQPMQLVQADRERDRTFAAVAHLDGGTVVQLATEDMPTVRFAPEGDASHAPGTSNLPYRQLVSWDGRYSDLYAVEVATGERHLVAQKTGGFATPSPAGRYMSWWDGAARHWMVVPLAGGEPVAASARVPHPVWNELDDRPDLPSSYGTAGWTEDDRALLFYDRYDVWRFEPPTGETTNLTEGAGRAAGIRFRYARTDFDEPHLDEGEALWEAFHYKSKQGGFYRGRTDRAATPEPVVMADKAFRFSGKADDADRWLITRQDFREFPDLWVTNGDVTDMVRLTDANPQQAEYRWGSAIPARARWTRWCPAF